MKPDEAASALAVYDNKFSRIKEDRNNLVKAKEALELADPGKGSPNNSCAALKYGGTLTVTSFQIMELKSLKCQVVDI